MKKKFEKKGRRVFFLVLKTFLVPLTILLSNLYLQLTQNSWSWELASKFAFSWHTEKFMLGCFVLMILLIFLMSLLGSFWGGLLFYIVSIGILGFANFQKMFYRVEPIYPDDLKMITELGLMKEMVGTGPFIICLVFIIVALAGVFYSLYRSFFLTKKQQWLRVSVLVVSSFGMYYIGQFNQDNNLLREAYDKTAKWIPYSQKMNYYNTGFMGGFLFNLNVDAMEKPKGYSQEAVDKIVERYQKQESQSTTETALPNIVYIMSESFSDPLRLKGLKTDANPLAAYKEVANQTYSGQMLSQNYGGGTANIEFEALTSLSMEPFNAQMTTPYTLLIPKLKELPSLVSLLKEDNYETTAIHPYNTSMYKRRDVYETLGFDRFLYDTTMTHKEKIENNPFISDESAFEEVYDQLEQEQPQFVHLVTMQTHLPYKDKYQSSTYSVSGVENPVTMDSYLQDIKYTSEALQRFLSKLDELPERTLVVFWGDHLPSIYSDEFQEQQKQVELHLTEFLIYDSQHSLKEQGENSSLLSPMYFAPKLFEMAGLNGTGFYRMVNQLSEVLPAFEKQFYLAKGEWFTENPLKNQEQLLYEEYQMIQYDVTEGEHYSLKTNFFKE